MDLIALKMLLGDKAKYYGLIAGIAFAAMLISQQASILVGFSRQTGAFIRDTSQADLWIMDPQIRFSQDRLPIRDTVVELARGTDGVQWAVPLYQDFARARMPDGTSFTALLVGIDDASLTGAPPMMVEGRLSDLRTNAGVFIDAHSAQTKLKMKHGGGRAMQVGDRFSIFDTEVKIVGSYLGRESFFWEPVIYTTYSRAVSMGNYERNEMSFVLVKIKPGQDIVQVRKMLAQRTGLEIRTNDEFIELTSDYILKETGVLINFGLAVFLGFVIGALIAGQTFYNFTLDNLRHYGSLKAMGVSNSTLARMVMLQAGVVAILGYGIGIGLGAGLGLLMASSGLAFYMHWQIPVMTFIAMASVCSAASWLSLRRVLALEPAIVFKT